MLNQNNSILLQNRLQDSYLLRRNIKVKSSRLPIDFFNNPELNRYSNKKFNLSKQSEAEENTRETYTPSFSRNENYSYNFTQALSTRNRKIGTARDILNKDDSLIQDVISTTKNIKRVFRRKSLQLKKDSFFREDQKVYLPKIANPRRLSHKF